MFGGWITIGTKIDTEKFDKQIADLEKKIQKEEKEKIEIDARISNIENAEKNLDKATVKAREYKEAIKELRKEQSRLENINPSLSSQTAGMKGPLVDQYNNIKNQIKDTNNLWKEQNAIISQSVSILNKEGSQLEDLKQKQSDLNQRTKEYKNKINSIKLQKQKKEIDGLKSSVDGVNNSLQKSITKIGRLVLGIFSIRSAYMFLRRASSDLASYDKQYATDLEYIRFALTQAIAPVLRWIVELAAKLLGYINAIWTRLFDVPLFANASADAFKRMKNSASGTSSAVKEIKKDLLGFDEINRLTDNGVVSGAAGVGIPSFDLGDNEVELPQWLKDIIDWFKPFTDFLKQIAEDKGPAVAAITGIVAALGGFLIIKTIIDLFKKLGKTTEATKTDFTKFFNKLGTSVEIISILGGIALVISQVTNLLKAFSESGLELSDVAQLLTIVLGEIAVVFTTIALLAKSMDYKAALGVIAILGGLAAVIASVTYLMEKFTDTEMELSDVAKLLGVVLIEVVVAMTALAAVGMLLASDPLILIGVLALALSLSVILIVIAETLPKLFDAIGKFINDIAPTIVQILTTIFACFIKLVEMLGKVLPPIIEALGNTFEKIFSGIEKIVTSVGIAVSSVLSGIKGIIKQIGDTISQVAVTIIWFIDNIGPSLERFSNSLMKTTTNIINFIISAIEYLINRIIDAVNQLASIAESIPGLNISRKSHISISRFYPRLKTGGIINMPNTGTLVGSAIAGESGREGVVPLTDKQAMEELGRTIGKYITVNANIVNSMNGRVISRELKQIQSEQDFAYNL